MLLVSVGFQPYTRSGKQYMRIPSHKTFHIALFVFLFLSLVACPAAAALYEVQAASNTVSLYKVPSEKDTKHAPCTRMAEPLAWSTIAGCMHFAGACDVYMHLPADQDVIHSVIITSRLLL